MGVTPAWDTLPVDMPIFPRCGLILRMPTQPACESQLPVRELLRASVCVDVAHSTPLVQNDTMQQ